MLTVMVRVLVEPLALMSMEGEKVVVAERRVRVKGQ